MKVHVLAFATAAEALGSRELELEVEPGLSVSQLLDRLSSEAPKLEVIRDRLAVAIDGELAGPETRLAEGTEVALLPPVSGGDSADDVRLVTEPIDVARVSTADSECGAEVLFLGRVREHSQGRAVTKIDYHGYASMARARLLAICHDLSHSGTRLRIVHRLGEVPVGEVSVAIAARAPHRKAAFAACSLALERLKREAPIWKLEHYADGSLAWREEEPLAAGSGSPASTA